MEDSRTYYVKKMIKLNSENSAAIMLAAQEIMDTGQLWVTLGDDEYYIPELIEQLKTLEEVENTNI